MKRKNLLHDLLSSHVLIRKHENPPILKNSRLCNGRNSDLYACKICFAWNNSKNLSIERRRFSDSEKESLQQIFGVSEPFLNDAFTGICHKCEDLLKQHYNLKRRLEEISICIKTVHRLQH